MTAALFLVAAVLSAIGSFKSFKARNIFGLAFGVPSALLFGWFAIMTIVFHGVPVPH
ncbi:MAG: DUF2759 domain-containing protein [Bacilli bacterium]